MGDDGGVDDEERRIKHYRGSQRILLVGEGNFSFAVCLAKAFGSAENIIATSLDSKGSLEQKYSQVTRNLKMLEELGCTILYEVDAHALSEHHSLSQKLFDRIVFNFPHAGFAGSNFSECSKKQIELHQKLVKGFFLSASFMLAKNGEVHVTHKTAHPFRSWNIKKLAEEVGLWLTNEVKFERWSYPGYMNKRGDGRKSNKTFPIGECSTFIFQKPNREIVD